MIIGTQNPNTTSMQIDTRTILSIITTGLEGWLRLSELECSKVAFSTVIVLLIVPLRSGRGLDLSGFGAPSQHLFSCCKKDLLSSWRCWLRDMTPQTPSELRVGIWQYELWAWPSTWPGRRITVVCRSRNDLGNDQFSSCPQAPTRSDWAWDGALAWAAGDYEVFTWASKSHWNNLVRRHGFQRENAKSAFLSNCWYAKTKPQKIASESSL